MWRNSKYLLQGFDTPFPGEQPSQHCRPRPGLCITALCPQQDSDTWDFQLLTPEHQTRSPTLGQTRQRRVYREATESSRPDAQSRTVALRCTARSRERRLSQGMAARRKRSTDTFGGAATLNPQVSVCNADTRICAHYFPSKGLLSSLGRHYPNRAGTLPVGRKTPFVPPTRAPDAVPESTPHSAQPVGVGTAPMNLPRIPHWAMRIFIGYGKGTTVDTEIIQRRSDGHKSKLLGPLHALSVIIKC
ncbi:hypothetical protein QBC34DRAFT_9276 [Podospora aff. communis PSN243]|uniref:Uncharacterized protein n=1 Tax=Podospora aff. communis PSN243 TaxID=3040156 RepID=A0AAV9H8I5_9PEZI|nr:hypothetical protein QBC34DRAFT_9276 [Podospora aff. communis PSN243]